MMLFCQTANAELSAIIEQELAIDNNAHSQKFETLFEPEWNFDISDNVNMTIIARIRWDAMGNLGPNVKKSENFGEANGPLLAGSEGELSLREWYIDTEFSKSFWRLGKQQVVWGQADGLKILDVVNPQSFREFILDDFDDSRIPLWMLNVEIPVRDEDSLQILWIPDTTYNEFAENGGPYALTSPLFVPQLPNNHTLTGFNSKKPSSLLKDSDFGMRYSMFYQGWDLTFNYFYHYHDSPVIYQIINTNTVEINSVYERNHLIGATASNAFGDFTIRTEAGYNTDSFHLSNDPDKKGIHQSAEFSSVLGLDWQGLEDTMLSIQWFQSHLFDYENSLIRPQNNNLFSFLYKQTFQNEVWEIEVLTLHGLDKADSSIQAKISYLMASNIKVWLGADNFYGSAEGLFGQFKNENRFTVGVEWGV